MANPTESAPSSATGGAKPISDSQLHKELSSSGTMQGERVPPSSESPAKQRQTTQEPGVNVTLGDDKGNRDVEPTLPNFRKAAEKMIKEKSEGGDTGEPVKEKEKTKVEPEKKKAVSADDAPPAAKTTPDEVPEDQRRVLPHDKPDTAKRIKAILAERDAARQESQAKAKEVEEARKAGASSEELTKLREEHQKLSDEALRLRRRYDIDNDPEFKAKYREPVQQAEKTIEDTLKKYGFGEGTMAAIKAEGGFGAFSSSNKTFTVQESDPENEGKTRPVTRTAAELARAWLQGLPVQDSEAIRASIGKQSLLRSEESSAISKAQEEAKGYFENQTKAQRDAQEKAQTAQQNTMKEYATWLEKTEKETDFLKDRDVPDNATSEQKKAIEEYNAFSGQLRANLRKDPTSAVEYGQLKLRAAEAEHLRRTMGDKDAEIERLREEVKRSKGAMRTTPKSGSLLKGDGEKPKGQNEMKDPTDLREGLRAGLAKFTGGDDE
jgi:hypothetical protein